MGEKSILRRAWEHFTGLFSPGYEEPMIPSLPLEPIDTRGMTEEDIAEIFAIPDEVLEELQKSLKTSESVETSIFDGMSKEEIDEMLEEKPERRYGPWLEWNYDL